jgi:hypothetical protein
MARSAAKSVRASRAATVRGKSRSVHGSLLGVRSAAAIVGYALCLVALGLVTGFAAESTGLAWAATLGTAATAGAMTASGQSLMGHLRGVMASRPIGGGR